MILFRYLTREVFTNMFAVTLTLLVVVMSGRFVKYLAEAASGDLAPEVLFGIMFYRMPGFLELVLPLGLFISILLAYGRLYVDSEMTVMSACGLSISRLALYTLFPAMLTAGLVGLLTLYLGPAGMQKVQDIFAEAKNSSGLETLVAGRFRVDERSGRVLYAESIGADRQQMLQVFSAEQVAGDGGMDVGVIIAESGRVESNDDGSGRYLVMQRGYHYIGTPGELQLRAVSFEEFGQRLQSPARQSIRPTKSEARSTAELMDSSTLADRATLQWRLSLIVLVPIIALIALAMSRTNPRRGRYVQMLPAFLLYIAYLVLLNTVREAVETGTLSVYYGFWLVHALFGGIALILLYANNWWRAWRSRQV